MKIGVMACSHDQIPEIKKAIKFFKAEKIDLLIHAGDWVSAFTLVYYKDLDCPIKGVWGNNIGDERFGKLAEKFKLNLKLYDPLCSIKADGKTIIVYHDFDDLDAKTKKEIEELKPNVIISAHDHKAKIETKEGILYINPGTFLKETFPWLKAKPSIALYDSEKNKADIVEL